MATYFIADTHFFDDTIGNITGVHLSNEEKINRWNDVVKPEDTVYHIGDVIGPKFDMNKSNDLAQIIRSLNGNKILIMGNHDSIFKSSLWRSELGFDEAYDHPIILNDFFILSHKPLFVNRSCPFAMAYGHIHNVPIYTDTPKNKCFSIELTTNHAPMRWNLFDGGYE